MECADLILLERTHDGVSDTSVVEQHQIILSPVMWVNQIRRNSGSLHLVQKFPSLLEVSDMGPVRVQCTFALCTGRQGINEKFGRAARGNFKM